MQGLLNGREIFLQDNFVAMDDANAGGADEYAREDDDEARINDMFEQVRFKGHRWSQHPSVFKIMVFPLPFIGPVLQGAVCKTGLVDQKAWYSLELTTGAI